MAIFIVVHSLYSLSGSLFLPPLVLEHGLVMPSYRCNQVAVHRLCLPSTHPTEQKKNTDYLF